MAASSGLPPPLDAPHSWYPQHHSGTLCDSPRHGMKRHNTGTTGMQVWMELHQPRLANTCARPQHHLVLGPRGAPHPRPLNHSPDRRFCRI